MWRCHWPILGVAQTSLGLGLLVEKITDDAGGIAPTVASLARQGRLDEALRARLDEFFEDLADAHVVLHDVSPSNIAYGRNADGKLGLYLIDGFGSLPLIPLYAWSRRLNPAACGRSRDAGLDGAPGAPGRRRPLGLIRHFPLPSYADARPRRRPRPLSRARRQAPCPAHPPRHSRDPRPGRRNGLRVQNAA